MQTCTSISICTESVACLIGNIRRCNVFRGSDAVFGFPSNHLIFNNSRSSHCSATYTSNPSSSFCIHRFKAKQRYLTSHTATSGTCCSSVTLNRIVGSRCHHRSICFSWLTRYQKMDLRLWGHNQIKCEVVPLSWIKQNLVAGMFFVLLLIGSGSQLSYADAPKGIGKKEVYCDDSSADHSQGKTVLKDYSVIGIPGDGRCLFRSLVHGACIRSGKPAPSESLQMELADELRCRVAEEFIKRRQETEWFIEGDFDAYISCIRKPHVWGGEPELLMASHVLETPISVYMHDEDAGGLISIAEYGQEYGKDNPIRVLFHGYGHYDALHVCGSGKPRPRL